MKTHNRNSYFTYLVECKDGTLYTGITYDLDHRMKQHNGILKGGAKYTTARNPVILKYFETYPTHKEAAQREYEIKQLTREEKLKMCNKVLAK